MGDLKQGKEHDKTFDCSDIAQTVSKFVIFQEGR